MPPAVVRMPLKHGVGQPWDGPFTCHASLFVVTEASGQSGKTIRDLRIRHETGAVIVALRKEDGTFDTTPDPDAVLDTGDVMIAAGSGDELRLLEELFAPREPVAR